MMGVPTRTPFCITGLKSSDLEHGIKDDNNKRKDEHRCLS